MEPLVNIPEQMVLLRFLDEDDMDTVEEFWNALWANYVRNKGTTSLPFWAEKFGNPHVFNGVLFTLKDWITTSVIPARNWGEAQLNEDRLLLDYTSEQLTQYRKDNKYTRYMPAFKEAHASTKVRVDGAIERTGLVRKGFAAAAMTQYYYDTDMLQQHKQGVINNTVKGMTKMRERYDIPCDDASYDQIATEIVESLATKPEIFTQEGNICDSRGRAIKRSLSKVANPIGYKDFRALLTIPE